MIDIYQFLGFIASVKDIVPCINAVTADNLSLFWWTCHSLWIFLLQILVLVFKEGMYPRINVVMAADDSVTALNKKNRLGRFVGAWVWWLFTSLPSTTLNLHASFFLQNKNMDYLFLFFYDNGNDSSHLLKKICSYGN